MVFSLLLALVAVSHAAGIAFFLEKFQAGSLLGNLLWKSSVKRKYFGMVCLRFTGLPRCEY